MAFSLPLPDPLPYQGWKVKIADKERNEPPHVTILRKREKWRFGLRERAFLDKAPDPADVPNEVIVEILAQAALLRSKWDEMYPENRVESKENRDE